MLKKSVTYRGFDGDMITEDVYFNLSKIEVTEMELAGDSSFAAELQGIVESGSPSKIMAAMKKIILAAYGQRSEDSKRFIKSSEISQRFTETLAYSELFMELVTDADAAVTFIRGVLPADLLAQVDKEAVNLPEINSTVSSTFAEPITDVQIVDSPTDPRKMTREELEAAFVRKVTKRTSE